MLVRAIGEGDRGEIARILRDRWGSDIVVSQGTIHRPAGLPGFVAIEAGAIVGLVTYRPSGDSWEVVTLDSLEPGAGVGSALLDAVARFAREAAARRLWLITTNDNTPALRFYQRRGWRLVALHREAILKSRALKPEIAAIGLDGIPIRDEIELELPLERPGAPG